MYSIEVTGNYYHKADIDNVASVEVFGWIGALASRRLPFDVLAAGHVWYTCNYRTAIGVEFYLRLFMFLERLMIPILKRSFE